MYIHNITLKMQHRVTHAGNSYNNLVLLLYSLLSLNNILVTANMPSVDTKFNKSERRRIIGQRKARISFEEIGNRIGRNASTVLQVWNDSASKQRKVGVRNLLVLAEEVQIVKNAS